MRRLTCLTFWEKYKRCASLSGQEWAFLADRLLSSLDDDALTEVDAAWIEEVERRYQDYKEG